MVIVKILGRANFTLSIDLKNLVGELVERHFRRFLFELSECVLMDSTFLGVLTGIAVQLRGMEDSSVQLLNPNPRITELLESLGVDHLFEIVECAPPMPETGTLQPQEPAHVTREEVTRTCLEAHQLLMEVNPANVPKFKDVTRFFEEDLKKLRATG